MTKSESKYFNTAKKMDEAFLSLLEVKDFDYITVKEICEKAHVNRSTFYLHYETIGDLLDESVNWMLEQFSEYYKNGSTSFVQDIETAPLEQLDLIVPEQLRPYLTYIKENKAIFRLTIDKAKILHMDSNFDFVSRTVFYPILERFQIPEREREYIISFYIEGLIGIVKQWLRTDCTDSIDEMIKVMIKVVKR